MIELIFAIVIIGIAVISLPMMTQITQRGIESSIDQEAIFAASAELMGATSYYWDNNRSMEDMALSRLERVVDVDGDCNADRLRPGHINQPFHRRCLDSNSAAGVNYTTGELTGVGLNRSVHVSQIIFTDNTKNAAGYKESYNSAVTIGASGNNVKIITVSVTDSAAKTITVLRTHSANIGEIDFYKRRF
jgi:hypothetical protein